MNAAEQQIKDWHEAEMQQVFEEEIRAKQQERANEIRRDPASNNHANRPRPY